MTYEWKEIGRFKARSLHGQTYDIIEYQDFLDASSQSSPDKVIPGKRRMYEAVGGDEVHEVLRVSEDEFKVFPTGVLLRRI